MNKYILNGVIFAAGLITGSGVAYAVLKKNFDERIQDAVDEVKEWYENMEDEEEITNVPKPRREDDKLETVTATMDKGDLAEYAEKIRREELEKSSDISKEEGYSNVLRPRREEEDEDIYTITPEEFGEFDDFKEEVLIYYADQIMADDDDEILLDIKNTIGFDCLNKFGEWEPDHVYVRNQLVKTDYLVIKDPRNFEDVVGEDLFTEDPRNFADVVGEDLFTEGE